MTVRRRSRRRPLTEFASRSPLHALGVGLLRFGLLVFLAALTYILVIHVLAPMMIDGMVETFQNRPR